MRIPPPAKGSISVEQVASSTSRPLHPGRLRTGRTLFAPTGLSWPGGIPAAVKRGSRHGDTMDRFQTNSPLRRYLSTIEPAAPGDGDQGGTGGTGDGPALPPAATATDRTFTQEELNRHAGRAREEGRKAADQAVADALGVSIEDAKNIIAERKAADEATKTEAQKDRETAAIERAEAATVKAEAAAERFAAKVERKLGAAGVDDKALARASRLVALESDADDDAIDAEIETLKTDVPGLFTTTSDGTPPPRGITPPRPPAGGSATGAESEYEAGVRLAREKYGHLRTA